MSNVFSKQLLALALTVAFSGGVVASEESLKETLGPDAVEQINAERAKMAESVSQMQKKLSVTQSTHNLSEAQVHGTDRVPKLKPGQGVVRMKELMGAIKDESYSELGEGVAKGVKSGVESATYSADASNMDPNTILSTIEQVDSWQNQALEAYVAALPPRDQALGRSIMLGDGTAEGHTGKVYIFVSRSMPMSLLRAYALDAAYAGATLVVKGIRKGDTVKDYVLEMLEDFNSAGGQVLASTEINPNLFDMFDVKVVPTVVWTNRTGLDETGSGCEAPPEMLAPQIDVPGPKGTTVRVEKPTCIQAPESSYFKLAGALKLDYVLGRFVERGAPSELLSGYRERLVERHANVHENVQPTLGNQMAPVFEDLQIDSLPKRVLEGWLEDLMEFNVQRGPYGPAFGEGEDDMVYRKELLEQIRHGLGLS